MIKVLHPVAGALALVTIATFWLSTALSELFASEAIVATAKTAIPWGFLLLIPALAAAGGSLRPTASWFSSPPRYSSRRRREPPNSISPTTQ